MPYQVSREGQTYGPYTLEDLQRYVASGNVLLTDTAKSDDSEEWIPVAQILGTSVPLAAPPLTPGYVPAPVNPYGTPAVSPYPNPPNLHWVLLIVISIFCGLFGFIWEIVQINWLRRIEPTSKATRYFILAYVLGFIAVPFFITADHSHNQSFASIFLLCLGGLIGLASAIFYILYRFAMKNSLEQHYNTVEPLGLRLGPIMTFFFGSLYFQYHFNRINEIKRASLYRGF
jgi:drug/metabolite transporter (DMT)-like permease